MAGQSIALVDQRMSVLNFCGQIAVGRSGFTVDRCEQGRTAFAGSASGTGGSKRLHIEFNSQTVTAGQQMQMQLRITADLFGWDDIGGVLFIVLSRRCLTASFLFGLLFRRFQVADFRMDRHQRCQLRDGLQHFAGRRIGNPQSFAQHRLQRLMRRFKKSDRNLVRGGFFETQIVVDFHLRFQDQLELRIIVSANNQRDRFLNDLERLITIAGVKNSRMADQARAPERVSN